MNRNDKPYFVFSAFWLLLSSILLVLLTFFGAGWKETVPYCLFCLMLWLFLIVPILIGGRHLLSVMITEIVVMVLFRFLTGGKAGTGVFPLLSAAAWLAGGMIGFRQRGRKGKNA